MVKYKINPGTISGSVAIPPSKSHTLRAIVFGLMASGKTTIYHYLKSPDTSYMIEAVKQFGAKVTVTEECISLEGVGGKLQPAANVIESGNSGQVLRFIGAIAALSDTYTVITGDDSIRSNRPIKPLLEGLEGLGAFAKSTRQNNFAPIIIKGPIRPGKTTLCGSDSQPVSGLLIAASFSKGPIHIQVENPGEKPWIDLTLNWLDKLGLPYSNDGYTHYIIPGNSRIDGFDTIIPGDFSSLAYPLVAAIITNSEVKLCNVDMKDSQGDKKIIETLIEMGAIIEIDEIGRSLTVKKGAKLKGMKIDINDFVDSITILAVVGCYASGTTEIVNGAIARKKESDRIHAITTELRKMGAKIEEKEDGMIITHSDLIGKEVETYHDHRMALSLSVAALGAIGETIINGAECVTKTYATFFEDFQKLGAKIEVIS
ncbi:MAG: 3-phosphoshikimate 1-carboxyvinyltransferase [Simkaniaceae bacterium]|nr:3-phosphoshikimate 1-carboxyvinyltransferase [Simkaniaceae bacterium]